MNLPSSLKKSFVAYIQLAAWLLSLITPFVVPPPFELPGGPTTVVASLSKFLLALFLGLLAYPLTKYSNKKYAARWWRRAVLLFVVSLVALPLYYWEYQQKVVVYETDTNVFTPMVIGNRLTDSAVSARNEVLRSTGVCTTQQLMAQFSPQSADDLPQIWQTGLAFNNYLLLGLHLFAIFLLAALVMATMQPLKINSKLTKREKNPVAGAA